MTSLSVLLINSEPEHSHGVKIYKDGNYGSSIEGAMNAWKSFLGGEIIDNTYIVSRKGLQGIKSNSKESKNKIGFAEATNYVANNWNRKVRKKVREVWGISNRYDNRIMKWLNNHQITPTKYKNKDVIILWIRKSGENGGAHYENDTSFKLLRSYIEKNSQKIFYLAGDDKLDAKGNSKAEALVRDNVVNLTQIWKRKDVNSWNGNSRTGQFNIYDFLKRQSKSLLHIGAMSGNLEAMVSKYNINKKYNVANSILEDRFKTKGCCLGGKENFHILPNGDIYPCSYGVGEAEFLIGNVMNGGLIESQIKKLMEINLSPVHKCQGCSDYAACLCTRCKIFNKVLQGDFFQPVPVICAIEHTKQKFWANSSK